MSVYQERFDAKWVEQGECRVWTGAKNSRGYGTMSYKGRVWLAHRLAWTWARGEIPSGLVIDHLCRNRACVKVEHLEPVTTKENVVARGLGPSATNAKVTHCPWGHEYAGENLYTRARGNRECVTCRRANCRRRYAEKKAKGAA